MKISPRLKRIFNFRNKEGKKEQDTTTATCDQHLYSNFYFNISQNPSYEKYEIQSCDTTIKELTEENVKKITKIKRSKSVENWLNDVELGEKVDSQGSQEVKKCCQDQDSTDLHYACVDVTNQKTEPSNILHSKLFASSSEIFLSYSSFSTFHSSSDSSLGFSLIN